MDFNKTSKNGGTPKRQKYNEITVTKEQVIENKF